MVLFIILVTILSLISLICIDYILKSMYMAYWDFIFRERFNALFENFNKVTVRRKTIDNFFVLRLKMYVLGDRPYEFIGDRKGNISLLGTKPKLLKPFFSDPIFAPFTVEIPKNLKDEYVDLINDISIMGPPKLERWYPDKSYVPPKELKFKLKELSYDPKQTKRDYNNELRKKCIRVFNKRRKTEKELYELIHFGNYIKRCVDDNIKTEDGMNKLITELIYDKVYGYGD